MGPAASAVPKTLGKGRFEAFSDGVFAIAITLLVIELSIGESGSALERVLDAWPHYLAYLVSFLTIGAAWLAHASIGDRLRHVDAIFLRLNLVLLLFVALLPFPTRLVAEAMHDASGTNVFVAMYGFTLMVIRLLLFCVDEYAYRENLYEHIEGEKDEVRRTILPVLFAYLAASLSGLLVPGIAFGLFTALAIVLVIPFKELSDLLTKSHRT